ncbi:hypothetical protein GCM10023088_51950 [Actinomadura verrucosospora]
MVGSGESEVDESAEVEGGGSGVEPGVGFDGASVAEAAGAVVDEPGDGVFDRWPPAAIVSLPGRVVGRLSALFPGTGSGTPSSAGRDASRRTPHREADPECLGGTAIDIRETVSCAAGQDFDGFLAGGHS